MFVLTDMDTKLLLDIPEIKERERQEKIKHKQLMETSKNICEIQTDINKKEILLVQHKNELESLTPECINLKIDYELQVTKQSMLENEIKKLDYEYNNRTKLLNEKYEGLYRDTKAFIEKSNSFLLGNKSSEMNLNVLSRKEIKTEKLHRMEYLGKISGLQMFSNVQKKLLEELK